MSRLQELADHFEEAGDHITGIVLREAAALITSHNSHTMERLIDARAELTRVENLLARGQE